MRETWVRPLSQEDPLEKGMATHSSILAWRIPWTEEPGGLQSMGSQRVGHDWAINTLQSRGEKLQRLIFLKEVVIQKQKTQVTYSFLVHFAKGWARQGLRTGRENSAGVGERGERKLPKA